MDDSIISIFTLVAALSVFSILCVVYIIALSAKINNINTQHNYELEVKEFEITELKSLLEEKIKLLEKKDAVLNIRTEQAFLSPVSGLPNLLGSQARIDDIFDRLERGIVEKVTLVYIDLDKFKPINDEYGHHSGDKVIKVAGKILQHSVRASDIVIHFSGDEFGIVCADTEEEEIEAMLARANIALAEYNFTFAKEGRVNTSYAFGVAISNKHLRTLEKLKKIADLKCMKIKKKSGESR